MQTVCHLGNVGCASLAEALPFSKLVTLTLSRQHRITATGIQALSRGLQNCQHLKHLELQRIPVDDDGAVALAGALGSSSLLTLELTISKISDRGAKALAHSLASSRTPRLESLGLTQNAIGLEGLEALEAAASVNMTLQRLELYGHAAGKAGSTHVWKIKPWLRMNRSSRQLLKCYCDKEHLLAHFVARVSKLPDPTRLFRVLLEIPLVFERSGCSNRIN
jgi:Ran GTPase-activating protein (RanGAP) involved in mRNA processing and transport